MKTLQHQIIICVVFHAINIRLLQKLFNFQSIYCTIANLILPGRLSEKPLIWTRICLLISSDNRRSASFSIDTQSSINWREKNPSKKRGGFSLRTNRRFSRAKDCSMLFKKNFTHTAAVCSILEKRSLYFTFTASYNVKTSWRMHFQSRGFEF